MTRHSSLGGITDVAKAAAAVVEDPCLGPVSTLVLRLQDLTPAAPSKPGAPVATAKGIGLCTAVTPLRAVVWLRQRPWVAPLGIAALIGGIFYAGYAAGRGGR